MTDQETPFERPMSVVEIIRAYEQQAEDNRRLWCALKLGVGLSFIMITLFSVAILWE